MARTSEVPRNTLPRRIAGLAVCTLLLLPAFPDPAAAQTDSTRLHDWETQPGFRLDVHARGFLLPTSIAFVPEPGPDPADPLYFVTELHGSVRVVTNDGSVHTFAEHFAPIQPVVPLPGGEGENGMAGICLDPAHGYVFVTYAFADTTGQLRNGITRFETRPRSFATEPAATLSLDWIFAQDKSANSHQIGPCQVQGGSLFVAVGDALESHMSRDPASTQGKILRMTLDGRPWPDNPFVMADDPGRNSWVWALGVRNVFGLKVIGERVFGAENGLDIDRFYELEKGRNYLWDGRDWSIGMNADLVFAPAVSPVQLDWVPAGHPAFPPEWQQKFYLALAGRAGVAGPGLLGQKSVVAIDYDFDRREVRSPPVPIVRYRGDAFGGIVGSAIGPDGLYFAPLYPGPDGTSEVIRLRYDPADPHTDIIGTNIRPAALMSDKGCLGCHQFRARGGEAGPSLDAPPLYQRLLQRLSNPAYLDSLAAIDKLDREPFIAFADARHQLAAASPADRPAIWVRNRLLEPRFDNPNAAMPNLALTADQADLLAGFLLEPPPPPAPPSLRQRLELPPARYRFVLFAFLFGLALPITVMLLIGFRRRRARLRP